MATARATCLLAVEVESCTHSPEKRKKLAAYPMAWTYEELFHSFHPEPVNRLETVVSTALTGENSFEIQNDLSLGSSVQHFGIKWVKFVCKQEKDDQVMRQLEEIHTEATTKAVDAFQILMAGGKAFPNKKTQSSGVKNGLSRKDELYNDLVRWCEQEGLSFPKNNSEQASYFVHVLCNALWYITNHQATIDDAARTRKELRPIPAPFDYYTGYNDTKRKKMKSLPLDRQTIESHAQALFSMLLKPYANSTEQWKKASVSIKASCLSLYGEYLVKQSEVSASNKASEEPVRTIDQHACVYQNMELASLEVAVEKTAPVIKAVCVKHVSIDRTKGRPSLSKQSAIVCRRETFCC